MNDDEYCDKQIKSVADQLCERKRKLVGQCGLPVLAVSVLKTIGTGEIEKYIQNIISSRGADETRTRYIIQCYINEVQRIPVKLMMKVEKRMTVMKRKAIGGIGLGVVIAVVLLPRLGTSC